MLELPLRADHVAPNGYLHAGTVVALADTACGYGCIASLPDGASGFTILLAVCPVLDYIDLALISTTTYDGYGYSGRGFVA